MRRLRDKLREDKGGLSEVVGALLLTLIVVVAAASFAVFVSQRQQSAQQQQLYNQQRSLEDLAVIGLNPSSDGNGNFSQLNFTVASNDNFASQVVKLSVNNYVVNTFKILVLGQTALISLKWSDVFVILSHEQVNIIITPTDLFEPGMHFASSQPVVIDFLTSLQNSFSHVFSPPSAVLSLNTEAEWNASIQNYTDYLILDGSGSTAQTGSFIVSYQWNIQNTTNQTKSLSLSGEKVRADFPARGANRITLTIEDNNGMINNDSVIYYY